jgi:endonuclease YncB( thermonuclease family)
MDIDGVRCQLLGIAEREHPYLRAQALEFAHRWLESNKPVWVSNKESPIRTDDGTILVWLKGGNDQEPLNCLLVQYGLAAVDITATADYRWTSDNKDGDYVVQWQESLEKARQVGRSPKKPYLSFEWPPTKREPR